MLDCPVGQPLYLHHISFFTPLRALCIAEISRFSPEEENSPMCQETHKTIEYSIFVCLLIIVARMDLFVKAIKIEMI